jgi:pyruvate dehydrogenase E2 component (dihydrolipoamide acetyltransferase)
VAGLVEVRMPKWGLTMEEGAVSTWHREIGEQVTVGDPLVDIEVDKTVVELESPASGTLEQIVAGSGVEVKAGDLLAVIAVAG